MLIFILNKKLIRRGDRRMEMTDEIAKRDLMIHIGGDMPDAPAFLLARWFYHPFLFIWLP